MTPARCLLLALLWTGGVGLPAITKRLAEQVLAFDQLRREVLTDPEPAAARHCATRPSKLCARRLRWWGGGAWQDACASDGLSLAENRRRYELDLVCTLDLRVGLLRLPVLAARFTR
jgi:hypothetical protein